MRSDTHPVNRHPSTARPSRSISDSRTVHDSRTAHDSRTVMDNGTTMRGGRAAEPSDAFDRNAQGGFSRVLRTLPLTLVLTVIAGIVLVTIATAIAYRAPDPSALVAPLAYGVLGVTSLIGGILASLRCRDAYVLSGLSAGVLFAALLTIGSFLVEPLAETMTATSFLPWLLRLGSVLLHLLGAYIVRPRAHAVSHASERHTGRGGHPSRHR